MAIWDRIYLMTPPDMAHTKEYWINRAEEISNGQHIQITTKVVGFGNREVSLTTIKMDKYDLEELKNELEAASVKDIVVTSSIPRQYTYDIERD